MREEDGIMTYRFREPEVVDEEAYLNEYHQLWSTFTHEHHRMPKRTRTVCVLALARRETCVLGRLPLELLFEVLAGIARPHETIFPRAPVDRLAHEIAADYRTSVRFEKAAMSLIHEAAEDFLQELFERMGAHCSAQGRNTVMCEDMLAVVETAPQTLGVLGAPILKHLRVKYGEKTPQADATKKAASHSAEWLLA